ncbi:phosphonoacetaldehyde hydrolase [Clostridium mediterraneense]|uniref:phosphonoacetaldehyde hydrolase n=1 Tax=Clostridium mediterraneense TaxID=1805472 RepID=UPI0008318613|nr:phosphonoacetaldehyde hydrolase [Clostridium mediterraneense]
MNIKGVIFDWAGTTIDYGCFSPVGAFIEAFKSKGIEITIDEAREPMGMLKIDHIRAILNMPRVKKLFKEKYNREATQEDVNQLYDRFEKVLFSSLSDYVKLNPYVLEVVDELRAREIKIGTTTGYTKEMMDIILPIANKEGYKPDFTIASDEVEKARPYPYMINENAKVLGIDNMKALVKVGDTVVDIKEGKNAGVFTVGVILGSSELGLTYDEVNNMNKQELKIKMNLVREKLLNAGADYVIDDMSELIEVIEKINLSLYVMN